MCVARSLVLPTVACTLCTALLASRMAALKNDKAIPLHLHVIKTNKLLHPCIIYWLILPCSTADSNFKRHCFRIVALLNWRAQFCIYLFNLPHATSPNTTQQVFANSFALRVPTFTFRVPPPTLLPTHQKLISQSLTPPHNSIS